MLVNRVRPRPYPPCRPSVPLIMQIMGVILDAPFHATKAALPAMIDAGWGRVVNTGAWAASNLFNKYRRSICCTSSRGSQRAAGVAGDAYTPAGCWGARAGRRPCHSWRSAAALAGARPERARAAWRARRWAR